jgi:hypothetical protein
MAKTFKPDFIRISAFTGKFEGGTCLGSLTSRGLLTSLKKEHRALLPLLLTLQAILPRHLLVVLMAIEDGDGSFLRNVSTSLPCYTASYRGRP